MASESMKDLWNRAKELLKEETSIITYETWIQPLEIKSVNDNVIVLLATSPYQREKVENMYIDLITNIFNFLTNKKCQIFIKLANEDTQPLSNFPKMENNKIFIESGLNPSYTFSNFVVGGNNKFAHAAAMGVAETPGSKYNPFFIWGGVGLGKTHLMYAIGNQILRNNPNAKVLYVTSENFMNQLINALKEQATEKFREKYRNIDVLLIDDIQFIADKRSTQEEFFHTFNALYEAGKQIVLSSDKPPKDIELLEERLKSRFAWGVTTDIGAPDYETRLAILKKKTQEDNILINDEILSAIATRVDTNIRELEGIIRKLIAEASLTNNPITMEMAERAINNVVSTQDKVISSEYVQEIVGKYFDVSPQDLKGSKRSNDVTFPRQIAMYLCRNVAQMSLPQIGNDFGKRDHTTVMHACNKIEKELKTNSNTKLIVESVKKILLSSN